MYCLWWCDFVWSRCNWIFKDYERFRRILDFYEKYYNFKRKTEKLDFGKYDLNEGIKSKFEKNDEKIEHQKGS